jgi:hypothetical protein
MLSSGWIRQGADSIRRCNQDECSPKSDGVYEHKSVVITTNLGVSEWASVLGDAKMTTALTRPAHPPCHILKRGRMAG